MACATKVKNQGKKFRVIVFQCPDCGEEKLYIVVCDHCGETMEYKETKLMTLEEIKQFLSQGGIIHGDVNKIMDDEEIDFEIPSEGSDEDIPPLGEDEMNEIFDDMEPL